MNPEIDLIDFQEQIESVRKYVGSVTVYTDYNDFALYIAQIMNTFLRAQPGKCVKSLRSSLGRGVFKPLLSKTSGELLDVDIIDASTVSSNVHEIRHSYFSLSREVIEDVRELVLNDVRAESRVSRLIKRGNNTNIFDFLVAPSFVSS